eukprot:TRINITY_DN617_c0_g1_i2.p1 TRINITY_DN617_c0_g1~~TRINITY_DN617_c0_g1_i2.p1  ORF type:complete len:470 (+),score=114.27 TRINITY_DN617_c0_g1_i2:76-1485(+)
MSPLGVLPLAAAAAAGAPLRPNIVWIMSDDLGWGEPGLYPSTSPHGRISTPNLDRFGKEGTVFTDAYAGYTVCAPSRTTFFTGRHSGQFKKYGLKGTTLAPGDATTLAQVLKGAGYKTGAFGKIAPLAAPQQQGFDDFLGQIDQSECHNMYPELIDSGAGPHTVNLTLNWKTCSRELCMAHPELYNYSIDVFHAHGVEWLQKHAGGSSPFFLYMSYTVPHAGGWVGTKESGAPVPSDGQYASQTSWPEVERDHAAVITYLDMLVGDLLARLVRLGVDDSTLVFFASDNGAHLEGGHSYSFFNSTGGLLGHKRSLHEGGVRSPTMVRWPGKVPAGRTSGFQWAFWDMLPTVAELAGATGTPQDLDGMSIVPTLLGQKQDPHEYLFFTWPGGKAAKGEGHSGYGVRQGKWKGVVGHCDTDERPSADDVMELYDLDADPFETTDIASQHKDVVSSLKTFVLAKNLTCNCYQC